MGEGHIHGLLGCNGIGKTTLLKIVCGIMRPDEGEVRVDGFNPIDHNPAMFSELMIIPEEFDLPNISLERYADITAPFYPRFDRGAMLHSARSCTLTQQSVYTLCRWVSVRRHISPLLWRAT